MPKVVLPSYTLPSLTYNGHHDEIPYALEGQLCQNKAPAGTFCRSSCHILAHKVGHLQTLLPDYEIKRRRKQRCVLNFVDFTSLHHSVGSSVPISWQITDRKNEAVRRKPSKYSISGLQLTRASNVAHVGVAT